MTKLLIGLFVLGTFSTYAQDSIDKICTFSVDNSRGVTIVKEIVYNEGVLKNPMQMRDIVLADGYKLSFLSLEHQQDTLEISYGAEKKYRMSLKKYGVEERTVRALNREFATFYLECSEFSH